MTRVVTLTYHTDGTYSYGRFQDDMGQWVEYSIHASDGSTKMKSFLEGDEVPVDMIDNNVHKSDIEMEALSLLGIPTDR